MDTTPSFTQKYVRKPLYVDAVQITEDNFGEAARWCTGEVRRINDDSVVDKSDPEAVEPRTQYIRVRVNNPKSPNQTKGKVGDWILYTDHGGYKVYTPKAFEGNFDLVSETVELSEPDDADTDAREVLANS